ncbi:MAG: hypothetical protein QOI11_3674 [Candidatus Eremiobacteraeota bacterium]|jgi:geranylgeranyl reductase family protein|nr:hypothetical protein [Candidatus Eremiobacteraeota bacterium]
MKRQQNRYDADVVVAGAGPAGAAVAARLASAGQRVVLLDRECFPRDKVCGDFVGSLALAELAALGLANPVSALGNPVRTAAVYVDGRRLITRPLPCADGSAEGRVIPRAVLDATIVRAAEKAGAILRELHTVSGYEQTCGGVVVVVRHGSEECRLRARLLIGADGSTSAVARVLRAAAHPRRDMLIAIRAYYDGVGGPADRCDLHFERTAWPGYAWLFPGSAGKGNVGVGMLVKTLPPPEEHLRDVLSRLVARDAPLRRRLRSASLCDKVVGWPLATYNPGLPLVADRVMLVGDAAGLVNPLNGEGIQYALTSARWASETALSALRGNDLSAARLHAYARRVDSELHLDMALSRLIVHAIANRWLGDVWLESLRRLVARAGHDERYARVAGGILSGVLPARGILRPRTLVASTEAVVGAVASALRERVRIGPPTTGRSADNGWIGERSAVTQWLGDCIGDATDLANQLAKAGRSRLGR